jgi:anti-sigma regulatory factor (Ser/Thr protein kinase)
MKITVAAIRSNIDPVTDFVNEQLKKMGCSPRSMKQIDVALDELFSNICNYAYDKMDVAGRATISVREIPEEGTVQITLEDDGIPFDPLALTDPNTKLPLEERSIGGLGIFMVKRTMNKVKYEFKDGVNTLTVTKSL